MLSRKAWTTQEDTALRQLHEVRGIKNWAQVSRLMLQLFHISRRSGKQCRQRYNNHLNQSIKHEKWTLEEEKTLINLHNQTGNRWAEIARLIPGRSQNCVKNQIYAILRRGLRSINKAIRTKLKRYKQLQTYVIYQIIEVCQLNFKRIAWTKQMHDFMALKKDIFHYASHNIDLNHDEQIKKIKQLIERIKALLKENRQKMEIKQKGTKRQSGTIKREEDQFNSPVVVKKQQTQKQRKDSFLSFRLQNTLESFKQTKEEKTLKQTLLKDRKESFQSNLSFSMNSPRFFDVTSPFSSLRSHQQAQFYQFVSPKPLLSKQAPFFGTWFPFFPK